MTIPLALSTYIPSLSPHLALCRCPRIPTPEPLYTGQVHRTSLPLPPRIRGLPASASWLGRPTLRPSFTIFLMPHPHIITCTHHHSPPYTSSHTSASPLSDPGPTLGWHSLHEPERYERQRTQKNRNLRLYTL
ncbi:hypothetical protein C8Q74DRAFT_63888 [Fomes fomentarius]|nr:hypothetical protein C8Q74DRAFT_63888 [Fomes fomentarius]